MRPSRVRFKVDGTPSPQRSKTVASNRDRSKVWLRDKNPKGLAAWRDAVTTAARAQAAAHGSFTTPFRADIIFYLKRPQKPKFEVPGVRPDKDKLLRATMDALTHSGLIADDSLDVDGRVEKHYADELNKPGALITITTYRKENQ